MKRFIGVVLLAAAFGGGLLVLAPPTSQASGQVASLDPATKAVAGTVVQGTVVRTVSAESRPGHPHLVSEIAVSFVEKGSADRTILVEVSGGRSGERIAVTAESPALAPGDVVELALVAAPEREVLPLLRAIPATAATDVYSIVGGLRGTVWLSGRSRDQLDAVSAMASGDFTYYPGTTGRPRKWASFMGTTYRVNPTNSGAPITDTLNAVHAGIEAWEDDPGSTVDYTYGGMTAATGLIPDSINVVSWVETPNPADSWIAEATWYFLVSVPNKIDSFDIRFNRDMGWGTDPAGTPGRFDIQTVATHEFGHTLGLTHAFGDPAEIMFPLIGASEVKRVPGIGDVEGIRGLYPDPRPQTCRGFAVTVDMALGERPTQGRDVIAGTNRGEHIDALGGDDVVCAGGGDDIVNGGPGDDTIDGQDGGDIVNGQSGADRLYGSAGADTLNGGMDADVVRGGTGDDTLIGGSGNDVLNGEHGDDLVAGDSGADHIAGASGNDDLRGGDGDDVIFGGPGADLLRGASGDDVLHGQDDGDVLYGQAGDDVLSGGDGDDVLSGGDDVDRCHGGPETDSAGQCETITGAP